MYKHILLAADLIEADDHPVCERASYLQDKTGAVLSIVHSIEIPTGYGGAYELPSVAQWQEDLEKSAKKRLKELAHKLNVPEDRTHLMIGTPKNEILAVAEDIHADLILVGSHGRHGLGLLLLGSTANAVLHGAKCDVMAVRV